MEKRHRIFIAINLPADISKALHKYSEKYSELPGKWTAKDNLHITLEFLGDLTDAEIADVCMVVKEVIERHESFSISINKISYGPDKKIPPKFVWAIGEKSKELADLKNDLQESLLEKVSFTPENRAFAPHITLARIGAFAWKSIDPEERPEISENIDLVFTAESIEVMESELRRGGPVYTVLESHQLK